MEEMKNMDPLLSIKAPLLDTAGLLVVFITYSLGVIDWLVQHEPYLKVGIELLTFCGLLWRGGTVVRRRWLRRKQVTNYTISDVVISEKGDEHGTSSLD